MDETEEGLRSLQDLLDRSDANATRHLREVITPARGLTAQQVCVRPTGLRLLALATVTSHGRPLIGPVDGVFYRGAFHFGSSPDSVPIRHVRCLAHVSATHVPAQELSVTVHGRAAPLDVRAEETAGLRQGLLDLYTPLYGATWEDFLDANVRVFVDADQMFTFHMA